MTTNLNSALLAFGAVASLSGSIVCSIPSLQAQTSSLEHLHRHGQPTAQSDAMSKMPEMSHENSDDSASRPWCQDVPWSTFNHRVTGTFLLLWGVSALIVAFQWPMRTWWRFVPPMFLFGLAEFLFFRNDPEAFPVGPKSYWVSLQDPEVFQHRVFLLLIILMAAIELLRAAERLPGLLAKYALPALGTFGAIYLFFHKHASGSMGAMMSHPATNMAPDPSMQQMMLSMNLIRHEHAWFSILGFGLVAAKLLGDTGHLKGRWGVMLWPLFAIVLGSYMMAYVE